AEQALAISLAHEVARPDQAVRLARRAKRDDATFLALGYPVLTVPGGPGPELALVLALIRQESAFNAQAVSTAGARGLMQLMPATAKKVSKNLNLRFSEGKLTQDPFYNMTLGRHYLDQQLADFSGSYVLAAAAYNAGPGRVRQWLKTIGDPRLSETDVIDWVEMIPFNETRDYVQRVIEGLQAYRWRLGEAQRVALIEHDLKRGRGNPPSALACQPPATANC
ncbi:MAG: lytic transglycosylase domain-containing protein, partial [Alphaproteobacteria bacterium]|nr:lytic transglycosylase domain-containing protein [Alphaproteobacteria bacterium]